MVLVTQRIARLSGTNGGETYVGATWDDVGGVENEDGSITYTDPNASMLVSAVHYKNTTEKIRYANVGGTVYEIPMDTQHTDRNLNKNQQTRIDSIAYVELR